MKQFLKLTASLIACLMLCGCLMVLPPAQTPPHSEQEETIPQTVETEPYAQTEPKQTQPQAGDYTLSLRENTPIYHGPSYESGFSRNVGQDGIYTIVEEHTDAQGNLWGKLKSGLGWVPLAVSGAQAPMVASFADDAFMEAGVYTPYIVDDGEYSVDLLLRSTDTVTQVTFYTLDPTTSGVSSICFSHPVLTPEVPLVVTLVFYGDMTTYGIEFLDADGNSRTYWIYISGLDGSLVFSEHKS